MNIGQQLLFLLAGTLATLGLYLGLGSLGPAGILITLLVPLPAAFVHMRQGGRHGGAVVLLSTGLLMVMSGGIGALGYLLQFGLASFLLPLLLRRGWPWDRAVALTLGTLAVAALAVLTAVSAQQGLSLAQLVGQYVHGEIQQALHAYKQAKLSADQMAQVQAVAKELAAFLQRAYAGLALTMSGIVLLCTVAFLARVSKGYYEIPGVPFHLWRTSDWLVWPLIAAGFALFFAPGLAGAVALNLLVVLLPIYFLQGLAIVSYFFRKKGIAPFLRALGYLLIAVLNPLPFIVTGLGVFDLWADFRRPRIKKS